MDARYREQRALEATSINLWAIDSDGRNSSAVLTTQQTICVPDDGHIDTKVIPIINHINCAGDDTRMARMLDGRMWVIDLYMPLFPTA